MKQTKQKLMEMYLDWLNNFITPICFAEYYHMDIQRALRIINIGRRLYNSKYN